MRLNRRNLIQWIVLLAVTLLVTRIAGNHLHLCFDGNEPPVSFHASDSEEHHEADTSHNDQDVELPSATFAKASPYMFDAVLLFAALVCLGLLPRSQRAPFIPLRLRLAYASIRLLRPPLRGPPAFLPR